MTSKHNDSGLLPQAAREQLKTLWQKVQLRQATEQQRIDVILLTVAQQDRASLPHLRALLCDDSENVRYFALQALVLDFRESTREMTNVCWQLLAVDSDEDVRAMAAACLGSIYFGQQRQDVFERLEKILCSEDESSHVKGSIYEALHQLAGLHPSKWPLTNFPNRIFEESDIDWSEVAKLKALMDK